MRRRNIISALVLATLLCGQPALAAKNCFWGYCNSKVAGEFGSKTSGKAAIYIPADVAQLYKGCSINTIKVGLAAKSSVTVYITKDLNGEAITQKNAGEIYKGWNEVKLSNAYVVDGEPFYIAYSYEGENNSLGVSSMYSENGCWADLGEGWKNYATEGAYHAPAIALQAKITGDNLPKDFWIYGNNSATLQKGKECQFNFGIKNMSPYVGRNFKVGYSIDGGEETVGDFSTTMGANVEKEFSFAYDGFDKVGVHTLKYRLIEVDGEKDAYPGNDEAVVTLKVVDEVPLQRVVVEEGTGTWCGYCPMGIVGLEKMYENYSDQFIGIAVHKSDNLSTTSYDDLTFSGYPKCYVNRDLKYPMQPSYEALETVLKTVKDDTPDVAVNVEANFVDDSKKQISAKALTTFLEARNGMDYRVSFVLTENGVTGYTQANNYSGSSTPMGGFENMGGYASIDMDHVARMNYSYDGVKGSIPASAEEGETTTYDAVLDVPNTVQTADNLQLIALVIDGSTGLISNAAEVKVGNQTTSVVDLQKTLAPEFSFDGDRINLNGFKGQVRIFNANGMEVPNHGLTPGLYIVNATDAGDTYVRKMLKK